MNRVFIAYRFDSFANYFSISGGSGFLVSDCRFGVSPVNYPDPDPDQGTSSIMRYVSE